MSKEKNTNIFKDIRQTLREIPFGETRSYTWLAERLAMPGRVRYLAKLLSTNPDLFSVPCHRIVCKNGRTGGYVLGAEFKKFLLEWEKSLC